VDIHLAADGNIRVLEHDNPSANVQVSNSDGLNVGDVVMICNMDYQMVFRITQLNSAGGGIGVQHNGGSSGNCSQVFQIFDDVADCNPGASGDGYCFTASTNPNCDEVGQSPAQISRVFAARWYIGNNARGGTSLYRTEVTNATGAPTAAAPVEIAEGATAMTITYLRQGQTAFVPAATITAADAWANVVAARVSITFTGTEGALRGTYIEGTDGEALERTVVNVVTLRNREEML
jgi:type IV pilus assembly protein PilW